MRHSGGMEAAMAAPAAAEVAMAGGGGWDGDLDHAVKQWGNARLKVSASTGIQH